MFKDASDKGSMIADLMLARVYRFGHGWKNSKVKCRYFYCSAVNKGSYYALMERGRFDIGNGKFFSGACDFIVGKFHLFRGTFHNLYRHGVIVDERIKGQ
ncbi:hypothetical protein EZV61_15610 [Corallincola luteus]|uniref:Uncharacterized protein n=1 Tax=Corallincola luteus TaxID=1775177 RepID=A0ABY2AIA3_9GAMM|nr:hypothetical protein EZV61_15610 [Corallincola luteus]